MKLFIDTANLDEIAAAKGWGILDGVTTNPTLIAREIERTHKKRRDILQEICKNVRGPVSAEGITLDAISIEKEGEDLARIHKNICVKVPVTPEGVKGMRMLRNKGIKVNATLVFSCNQALIAAKAGANFVSPFIGRLDDIGESGMNLVAEIVTMFDNYDFETEVLVASVRSPAQVVEATQLGAHVCTVPFKVLEMMFKHPLTDNGITRFLEDWEKARALVLE
jgi:transaldolase